MLALANPYPVSLCPFKDPIVAFCCEVIGCDLLWQSAVGSSSSSAIRTSKPMQKIDRHPILSVTGVDC